MHRELAELVYLTATLRKFSSARYTDKLSRGAGEVLIYLPRSTRRCAFVGDLCLCVSVWEYIYIYFTRNAVFSGFVRNFPLLGGGLSGDEIFFSVVIFRDEGQM